VGAYDVRTYVVISVIRVVQNRRGARCRENPFGFAIHGRVPSRRRFVKKPRSAGASAQENATRVISRARVRAWTRRRTM